MNLDEAIYGPKCRECKSQRTRNPSKACGSCLADRACHRCKGTGVDPRGYYAGLAACPACPGTGLASPQATAAEERVTQVEAELALLREAGPYRSAPPNERRSQPAKPEDNDG
jgi:hypothetical protein